jgi:SAM-dependent methyltransferase
MPGIDTDIAALIRVPSRLLGSDSDIEAAFWAAYPRFRFVKCLPWGARLLDIGAGNGGLAMWREWQTPRRPDIRMFGLDLQRGTHAHLYEAWEVADLDQGLPDFGGTIFDAFLASHLIEHVGDPLALLRNIAAVAAPAARFYLEWPNPVTTQLPSARQLEREHGFVIQTFNFYDDDTHRQTPERSEVEAMLAEVGFHVIESAETRLGVLAEEMIARGRMRDDLTFRQMGLWSSVGWSNVVIAESTRTER